MESYADKSTERWAERICEVVNELDRLERLTGRAIGASLIAIALGWSSMDLAEEVLNEAVRIGCAVVDRSDGGYRLA